MGDSHFRVTAVYLSIFGLGMFGVVGGLWNAAHGKKAPKPSAE
jgi:hypothetical protein